MDISERQDLFEKSLKADPAFTKATKFSASYGFANTSKVVDWGIFLGGPNLQNFGTDVDGSVMAFVMRFLPDDEVYFAVEVRTHVRELRRRLDEMLALAASSTQTSIPGQKPFTYSDSNNNAKVYLARDGLLYLRNQGFWDSLDFDLSLVGPGIMIDRISVALWPPAATARRSSLAREFVGYLGKYVGREKLRELTPWKDPLAVRATMRRMPRDIPVPEIRKAIEDQGGHYPDGLIERYHAALSFHPTKHYVVLAGLSGTGKTQLAIQYARAVHGISEADDPDPLFYHCPVRPDWTDPSGLTGYTDVLTNRYVVPTFLEAVLAARANRDSPVFVLLDEMNLARVEYYLSDVLSVMETPNSGRLVLHANDIPMEGSRGGEIEAQVAMLPNLFITGTINVDETTSPISDKVLDRAVLIDMPDVDLPGYLGRLIAREPGLKASIDACRQPLVETMSRLTPHGLGFGYRTADEFIRYHFFATSVCGTSPAEVIDDLLVQKVLVKLRGTEAQRSLLTELGTYLNDRTRSARVIARLMKDLDDTGSFQNTR